MYLPKDKVVITTQHVRDIKTLDKTQNEQVQRLYLREDSAEAEEEQSSADVSSAGADGTAGMGSANGREKTAKRRGKKAKKKPWSRERPVTRSVGRDTAGEMGEAAEQEEVSGDVVNNAVEVDPKNYREAMSSSIKEKWLKAI